MWAPPTGGTLDSRVPPVGGAHTVPMRQNRPRRDVQAHATVQGRGMHRARTALRYPTHAHADHPTIVRRHMSGLASLGGRAEPTGGTLRLSRAHRGHPAPGRSPPSVRSPLVPLRSSPKSHSLIEGRWSRLPGGGGGIRPRIWFSACAEIVLWSFRDSGQDAYIGRRAQWPGRPPLWGFAGDPARVVRAGERE